MIKEPSEKSIGADNSLQGMLMDNGCLNMNDSEAVAVPQPERVIFVKRKMQPSNVRELLQRAGGVRQIIPTNEAERLHVEGKYGHLSWQKKVLEFVHSTPVQITLAALLLLDVFVLFIDLFLDSTFPDCSRVTAEAISCCISDINASRFLGSEEHNDLCNPPLVETPENPAACDPHKYAWLHTVHNALFWTTFTILSIFLTELILLIIVLGVVFFHHWFYVMDLFIIVISLALEISFYVIHEDVLADLVALLILSRMWRFVRIGHGLVEATVEVFSVTHEVYQAYVDELEQLVNQSEIQIPEHTQKLRDKVHKMTSLQE